MEHFAHGPTLKRALARACIQGEPGIDDLCRRYFRQGSATNFGDTKVEPQHAERIEVLLEKCPEDQNLPRRIESVVREPSTTTVASSTNEINPDTGIAPSKSELDMLLEKLEMKIRRLEEKIASGEEQRKREMAELKMKIFELIDSL